MTDLTFDHSVGRSTLIGAVDAFVGAVSSLTDHELLAASRCHGWVRLDVVVHVRTGLQEMLGGFSARSPHPSDQDAASY